MRVLGLDVGEKRIGVARADLNTRIAIPVGTINADGSEWEELARLTRLYDARLFVLGLPRNNSGVETAQSLYVRNFAKTLAEKVPGAKIRFQDETLTSVEAEKRLKSRKKSYEKSEIDAEAATIILQDFVEHFETTIANFKPTNPIERNAKKAMLKSKKVAHKSKKLTRFFILSPILLCFMALFIGGAFWFFEMLAPIDKSCANACKEQSFTVTDGDSIDAIATNLENSGFIRSAFVFKLYQKVRRSDITLKSGTYTLNNGLSVDQIIALLAAGAKDSNVFSFTIRPGETLFDIKKRLADIGYTTTEIDAALNKSYENPVLAEKPADASLEGYLFGQTHEFYKNTTVEEIIETYLKESETKVTEHGLREKFLARGLTLHQGITLASIIQKEAYPADQPTVAQVFYSRLKIGKHLGSDVTVQYALNLLDPNREIYQDNASALKIDSCYNTSEAYGHAGLPCGPISNPGLSALLAAAEPADTSYLYFLTGDDGKMYYSYTESEHYQNRAAHCQVLCDIAL